MAKVWKSSVWPILNCKMNVEVRDDDDGVSIGIVTNLESEKVTLEGVDERDVEGMRVDEDQDDVGCPMAATD